MMMGKRAWLLLAAAPLVAGLAGCGNFWQAPSSGSSFTLSNSGNITVAPGATTGNTSTITVTPSSSFTGTVALTCAVTAPSGASNATTCGLSTSSLTFSSSTAQTSTLTATTTSATTAGDYTVTVTGTSGSVTETTSVCVDVTTSATSNCSSASGTSGKFYILSAPSSSSTTIVGESISSGSITQISGSPWAVSGVPFTTASTMAIAPSGNFLCVSTTSGVFAYPITNGVLGTAAYASQDEDADLIQVDQTGTWLVEAILSTNQVVLSAVPISPSTGANEGTRSVGTTAPISVIGAAAHQMVISQDNKYVFVALGAGGTLVVPFNPTTGFTTGETATTLITVANPPGGGSALSVAVDPSATPRLIYIGETWADPTKTTGGLRIFDYSSLSSSPNALTPATGSPIASGGLAPNFILPDASGNYVYVANGQGNGANDPGIVAGFTISGSSPYTIATDSTVATGVQPLGMAEDSTDSYVFAVDSLYTPSFDAYPLNANNGQLGTAVSGSTATSAIAIVAAP